MRLQKRNPWNSKKEGTFLERLRESGVHLRGVRATHRSEESPVWYLGEVNFEAAEHAADHCRDG
jgi:hypothetical protein